MYQSIGLVKSPDKKGYKTMKSTKKFIVSAIIFAALATTIFSELTSASYIKSGTFSMMPDSTGGDTTDGNGGGTGIPPIGH